MSTSSLSKGAVILNSQGVRIWIGQRDAFWRHFKESSGSCCGVKASPKGKFQVCRVNRSSAASSQHDGFKDNKCV